jgi:tetratricopeptide (TPR) repeat protein
VKRGATRNIAAYELYLRGNDPTLLRSDSGARHALEYLRQAIALDSNYAAAYAGLARLQMIVGARDDPALPRREVLARAEQTARKAVALDDSLADAHASLSLVHRSNYDFASAETEMKRAVALDTADARILGWLVQLDVWTERPAEALVAARRALALDPLSPAVNAELARAFLANGRCDEALAQLEKLRSLTPPLLRARSIAAQCYARRQMWPEAIEEMQRIPAAAARGNALLGYMLARAGRTSEARRILGGLLDPSSKMSGGSFEIATVYAGLGENEQAFAWLDKAVDDRSVVFDYFELILDTLPRDARLDRLRERLGLQKR